MHLFSRSRLLTAILVLEICFASPLEKRPETGSLHFVERAATAYTLPQNSKDPLGRAGAIAVTKVGFTYGAAVAGGPFYPSGALGLVKTAADQAAIQLEVLPEGALAAKDTAAATAGALLDKVQRTE